MSTSGCGDKQVDAVSISISRFGVKSQHAINIPLKAIACALGIMLLIAEHIFFIDPAALNYLSSCLRPRRVVGAASVDASSVPTI